MINECLEEELGLILDELETKGSVVRKATPLVWQCLEELLPTAKMAATVSILAYNMVENTITLIPA